MANLEEASQVVASTNYAFIWEEIALHDGIIKNECNFTTVDFSNSQTSLSMIFKKDDFLGKLINF